MAYHGNPRDPADKTPHLIRHEHARQVVDNGGSVLLFGRLYTKANFDQFPRELEFSQFSAGEAARARVDIRRRMDELQSEARKLDEAQEAGAAAGPTRPGRLADILNAFRGGTKSGSPGGSSDEYERWRKQQQQAAAGPSGAAESIEDEPRLMTGQTIDEANAESNRAAAAEEPAANPAATTGDSPQDVLQKREKRKGQ